MTSEQANGLLWFYQEKRAQGFSKEEIDVLLMLVDVVDWEQQKSTAQGNQSDRAVRYETETTYEGAIAC